MECWVGVRQTITPALQCTPGRPRSALSDHHRSGYEIHQPAEKFSAGCSKGLRGEAREDR
jgi:hypothetical protein